MQNATKSSIAVRIQNWKNVQISKLFFRTFLCFFSSFQRLRLAAAAAAPPDKRQSPLRPRQALL